MSAPRSPSPDSGLDGRGFQSPATGGSPLLTQGGASGSPAAAPAPAEAVKSKKTAKPAPVKKAPRSDEQRRTSGRPTTKTSTFKAPNFKTDTKKSKGARADVKKSAAKTPAKGKVASAKLKKPAAAAEEGGKKRGRPVGSKNKQKPAKQDTATA
jgi:hypothetical protein